MIAVRREDARQWPCPWLTYPPSGGVSSRPEEWPVAEARRYVDKQRNEQRPLAVYSYHGYVQRKIWPR